MYSTLLNIKSIHSLLEYPLLYLVKHSFTAQQIYVSSMFVSQGEYLHLYLAVAHIGIFVGIATCDIPVLDNIPKFFNTGFCYRGNCAVNSTAFYLCDVTGLDIFDGSASITCVGNNTWFPPLGTSVPGEFNTFQLPKVAKRSIHTCD